ncbi:MAG: peptidase T [Lachnospiraceae bacterium]|nr:peptidase T [Lachnospiraceae bacterium]
MSEVIERFLKYVKIDTQSEEKEDGTFPSTEKQKNLALLLKQELEEMGAEEIFYDEKYCYVYATIPATTEKEVPVLGFIAHMDTSPAISGANVNPRVVKNYDGKDIILNQQENIVLSSEAFPEIKEYVGKDLIVTDGLTLLGADDKAGVSEIITMAAFLCKHKEVKHGKIRIAFTPDEEVGAGVDYFDVERFGADFAYTVDGGKLGELEYENFNAAGAKLTIHGCSVHPGDAKNKMLNALLLAQEFQGMLPVEQNPMYTEKYEGFFHLDALSGTVEQAVADYIIRDHDKAKFEEKKRKFLAVASFLNDKYGAGTIEVNLKDSYYNMKEKIEPHMHLIENAKRAMEELSVEPIVTPIRGGTDGARLSFMGLPCPNLCTGGHNFHGKYEYICVQSMEAVVKILLKIIEIYAG